MSKLSDRQERERVRTSDNSELTKNSEAPRWEFVFS